MGDTIFNSHYKSNTETETELNDRVIVYLQKYADYLQKQLDKKMSGLSSNETKPDQSQLIDRIKTGSPN